MLSRWSVREPHGPTSGDTHAGTVATWNEHRRWHLVPTGKSLPFSQSQRCDQRLGSRSPTGRKLHRLALFFFFHVCRRRDRGAIWNDPNSQLSRGDRYRRQCRAWRGFCISAPTIGRPALVPWAGNYGQFAHGFADVPGSRSTRGSLSRLRRHSAKMQTAAGWSGRR
jgi:hypothetical protein